MPGTDGKTSETAPKGPPPQGDDPMNGPGMTNGVPDGMSDGEPTASPDSSRHDAEKPSGSDG